MEFNKNTIIGLVLMLALAFGVSWYNAKDAQEKAEQQAAQLVNTPTPEPQQNASSTNESVSTSNIPVADASALVAERGVFGAQTQGTPGIVVLENNKIKVKINQQGATLHSVELKDDRYLTYWDKQHIQFWDSLSQKMNWTWVDQQKGQQFSWQYFFQSSTIASDGRGNQSVVLSLDNGSGKKFSVQYTLPSDSHELQCKIMAEQLQNDWNFANGNFKLDWQTSGLTNEKGIQSERSRSSVFFCEMDKDRDYLSETGGADKVIENRLQWIAFKQNYFSTAVIADNGFQNNGRLAVMTPEDSVHTKVFWAQMPLDLSAGQQNLRFFFGPNEQALLSSTEVHEFDRIIDYGWGIIGWVNKYAVRPLFWLLSSWIASFGLIILIVTVIIKTVLFPITWKNLLNGAKMRAIKPELDELNKKYEGKDPMEKQSATMALYKQTGVNPFAGCIPVLIQMPVLYAMFRFFPAEIVLRGKSFLWAEDLAAYDSILNLPFDIPFYGDHVSLFTILMCASTFVYTKMSMSSQPTMTQPGMPNMNVMMNIFTFMMLFFFNSMPSGLTMYYFVANVLSIGQMWAIRKYFINEADIRSKIETNKQKPVKKSSFQQRLEEMQNAQKKKLETQKKKLK
jgi:YidC/Oxa1 family membrane protein insertase